MALKAFYILAILLGHCFVDFILCDESSSTAKPIRRKRQVAATTSDFITVADIAEYLSGGNHRKISSIAMIEANQVEVEDDAKKWPKVDFSMATDVPIVTPPPACDDTSRSNAVLSILRTVTPENVLLNTVTPQGMAFAWLLSEDPAATTTLKNPCDNMRAIQQRFAMVVLYYSTSGDSWTDNTGWLTKEDACTWVKVTCHADQPSVIALALCTSAKYDQQIHRTATHFVFRLLLLYLFNILAAANNLIGELPEEIKILEYTEEFYLYGNKLKGTLPDGIKSMKQLRNLDIERNEFSGQPLVKLYGLLNLRELHLSDNQFDEQISGPGIANWELLKELWIGNNLFRGAIPEEIGRMESLGTSYSLYFRSYLCANQIQLSHNVDIVDFVQYAESLLIYGNELTGTIPSSMGANRIIELIAHENMLDGTIPESLFNNIDMTILRLDSNNFNGQLSSSVGDLSKLVELRLGRNKFNGSIPSSLWKLTSLRKCININIAFANYFGRILTVVPVMCRITQC